MNQKPQRVVVIGAGIAGLTAALRARANGAEVRIITMGVGGLQLGQGTIDVYGPMSARVDDPFALMKELPQSHPYHQIGSPRLRAALRYFSELDPQLESSTGAKLPQKNMLLPTAIGALRPTYLAPASMIGGAIRPGLKMTIVGIREYKDLYPELVCGNLNRQVLPDGGRVFATPRWISFPGRDDEADSNSVSIARRLDDPLARREFAAALKQILPNDDSIVGVPAVLGYADANAHADIEKLLDGRKVFEIPSLPPAMPGVRLNNRLLQLAKDAGIRIVLGARVVGAKTQGKQVEAVTVETAGRNRDYRADLFIHCPGGFESWGLQMDSYGNVSEPVFNLPISGLEDGVDPIQANWYEPQPLFAAGIATDAEMRPRDKDGNIVFENLRVAGSILAGATRWQEKSGEGIAIGSAVIAADALKEGE